MPPAAPAPDNLQTQLSRIRWYHQLDLGDGLITPGPNKTALALRRIQMPATLAGKTVLDIGAWDGYYSFEAERRGARHVLAIDSGCWGQPGWLEHSGFLLAHRHYQSHVAYAELDLYDLDPKTHGVFDVVLCLGVLYHLEHPLLALQKIADVTGEQLILETHLDQVGASEPRMVFYPGTEHNQDPTNWWGPNPAAVRAMLLQAGFRRVETVFQLNPLQRLVYGLTEKRGPLLQRLQVSRAVFHAFK